MGCCTAHCQREEALLLQQQISNDGHDFDLKFWDWRYYAEKVRKEKYDLDESEMSQYFEIKQCARWNLHGCGKTVGASALLQRTDVPVYHPDATAWEVLEADGKHLGILVYGYAPKSKQTGRRMDEQLPQPVH
jgi:peptidyl-dipeptidase Dcp